MKGAIKMFIFRGNNKIFMNVTCVYLSTDVNNAPALKVKTLGFETALIKTYATPKEAAADFNRICNELKVGKNYIEVR